MTPTIKLEIPAIQTVSLTKKYGDTIALDELNLSIAKKEIFCLLGQNGAGKTTTINLLLGFSNATSGKSYINGERVRQTNSVSRTHLAYIPEIVQLYGNLTGIENLDFFSRLAGFKYSNESLINFLNKAGLPSGAHSKRLSSYSKGMRQKVGIAIALAKNAEVILMDEPTSGLDPKAIADFTRICKDLAGQGKTIFMATHDLFNAVNVGTRIGIMKQGSLIHTLSTENINAEELLALYLKTI